MKLNRLKSMATILLGGAVAILLGQQGELQVGAQETETTEERIFMLNVLWFKEDGGAKKYQEYMKAARPFVVKYGGKSDRAYIPEANLIGKFDADLVFFVEWPNQKAFTEFVQDAGYRAISHLRGEAIRDSLLIQCRSM